jgi:patatin-like phospholipase/acyl hydrolase
VLNIIVDKRGKRLLALDGGGIRGIMELVILNEIEKKTGRKVILCYSTYNVYIYVVFGIDLRVI